MFGFMKTISFLAALCFVAQLTAAEVPTEIQHQGRIAVDGVNFDGTGQFKFLLYHGKGPGNIAFPLWKNNDSNPANSAEPTSAVSASVTKGLYSIDLGGSLQQPITANLIPTPPHKLYLRIWFNDGVNGFQLLSPDKKFSSAAFARHSDLSENNISELINDANFLSANPDVTIAGNLSVAGEANFGTGTSASVTDAMAWGTNSSANSSGATAWGFLTEANGYLSTSSGFSTIAESAMETVIGRFDTDYTPASIGSWNTADRLFVIGKGANSANRADALVMLKSGDTTLNGELTVNDDVMASGSFKYKTPKTFKLQIAGSELTPGPSTGGGAYFGLMQFVSSSGEHRHMVQPKLPTGATVTQVTLHYFEDSAEGSGQILTVGALMRKRTLADNQPENSTPMAYINQSHSGPWARSYQTSSIANATLSENELVYMDIVTEVSNTINIGIAGVTIEYTTDTVKP